MKTFQITFEGSPRFRGAPYRKLIDLGYPVEERGFVDARALPGTLAAEFIRSEVVSHHEHVNFSVRELACLLSHLKAWNEFWSSGDDFALFLEDDTTPLIPYSEFVEESKTWPEFNLMQVEWTHWYLGHEDLGFDHPKAVSLRPCGYGAMAYVLSRPGCRELLDQGSVKPTDLKFMEMAMVDGGVFRLKTKLFEHDYEEPSTVQPIK